jgi:EAL domain-containing protein (putative c-di-GMP-specific phosphodiesterase class I)
LIVEKVADEGSLERLMQYGTELAEGDLFAAPKPVTAETLSELGGAEMA